MSVVVEGISVIVRRSILEQKYPGGFNTYRTNCPNKTFCADAHLTRVGFMVPNDVQQFVGQLQMHGLEFVSEGIAADIAVLDQMRGPTVPCSWLEFTKYPDGVAVCWLAGEEPGDLAAPAGWRPGGVHFQDTTSDAPVARGESDGVDVFEDPVSGERAFVGRVRGDSARLKPGDTVAVAREKAAIVDGRWQVGDRLDGRWPIYRVMKGGMGLVYVVQDAKRRQLVAAKTFQDAIFQGLGGANVAERFNIEAKTWISLGEHENIVHAFDVKNIDGKPYLFMEYVNGESLSELIRRGDLKSDRSQVIKLATDFARGMKYACSRGLHAHRDVKPDNCLIAKDGSLKITDFGLAKIIEDVDSFAPRGDKKKVRKGAFARLASKFFGQGTLEEDVLDNSAREKGVTTAGVTAGTPTHMAPEQFVDTRSVDVRADVYSFGVMMYEMLSGRLPFQGKSFEALVRQHMTERPARIAGVSDSLWSGLEKCLAKQPKSRFSSFQEVLDWLAYEAGDEAQESRSDAASRKNEDGGSALDKAYTAANLGLHVEALQWCSKAIDVDPDDYEAWSLRGRVLVTLGRAQEGIEAHEQATTINPNSAEAWHAMGVGMNALGRNAEALECYEQSIRCNDGYAQAWYDKGVAHRELGNLDSAGRCWDRCIQLAPDHSMAWCNRGSVHQEAGDEEAAVACYRKAVQLNAGDEIAWFNLGGLLVRQSDFTEAIRCFETAERLGMSRAADAKRWCMQRLRQSPGG